MPEIVHMNADEPERPVWFDSDPFTLTPVTIQPGEWVARQSLYWNWYTSDLIRKEVENWFASYVKDPECAESDAVIQCPPS